MKDHLDKFIVGLTLILLVGIILELCFHIY